MAHMFAITPVSDTGFVYSIMRKPKGGVVTIDRIVVTLQGSVINHYRALHVSVDGDRVR